MRHTMPVFELYESRGLDRAHYRAAYLSFKAARDAAVPDHDNEWIWSNEMGCWYHGGGSEEGQAFYIYQKVRTS